MRKLIMKMSISMDGFVSTADGGNDWIFKTGDEESKAWSVAKIQEGGLIIMGRKSFENMAPYWPTAPGPFAAPMNEIPKAVFSQKGFKGVDPLPAATPQHAAAATWAQARIFDGDLVEGIRQLKSEPGKPIVAIGGAGFMQSLIATSLIDEYVLAIHPRTGLGFAHLHRSCKSTLPEAGRRKDLPRRSCGTHLPSGLGRRLYTYYHA